MLYYQRQAGKREERGGRNYIKISYEKEAIPYYQRELLKAYDGKLFLPMAFFLKNGSYQAYYDVTGYVSMELWIERQKSLRLPEIAAEGVSLLKDIFTQVIRAEQYLFCLSDFELDCKNVFVKVDTGTARLAFVPVTEHTPISNCVEQEDAVLNFLTDFERLMGSGVWELLGKKLKDEIVETNAGIVSLLSLLRRMEEEFT